MPLASIEKTFMRSLLQPQIGDADFLSELMPLDSINEETQLSIYRSNVDGAYQKALLAIYPACLNILGEDYFQQLCLLYRYEYPSTKSDLNSYGKYFSLFMEKQLLQHQELMGMEYLSDLADLEWHWHESYYAKDDEGFSFEKLALINTEAQDKIYFRLGNSFSLHSSIYPLLDIWNANREDVNSCQEFNMPDVKTYFCVYRADFHPVVVMLDHEQYLLLKPIFDGLPLAQLMNVDGVHTANVENMLLSFIQQDWIAGFCIKD